MIRAIKTKYQGILYQSTLEADWAKTLDAMKMRFEYEPEGLKLSTGENYRCDFRLPLLATYLEVKGDHNQRISKTGHLADDLLHAPGCRDGQPVDVLDHPGGTCPCGFGARYPWRVVVVGRAAVAGRLTFAGPTDSVAFPDPRIVVLKCPVCQQFSFAEKSCLPLCRRCRQDATGGQAFPSGGLPFHRVEPPRGRSRRAS